MIACITQKWLFYLSKPEDSEPRYRSLFEGSLEGILIADIQTMNFKYANPALLLITLNVHREMLVQYELTVEAETLYY